MSVLRQQFGRTLAVTVTNGTTAEADLFGPESLLETPYAEGTDHVIRERQSRQNEAGFLVIDGWANLAVATVTLDIEIWERASAASQRGLSDGPLFPSGAAAAADPSLKRVVATGLAGDSGLVTSLFGGGFGGTTTKDVPALALRANEFVKLRIANASGGDLTDTLATKYDLGGNPGDTHRLA